MIGRDYQLMGVEAVYTHLETRKDNPCVVVPTGGGKSWMIARICADAVGQWGGKVVVLSHVKELLEQSLNHLTKADPTLTVGVYSAGLGARELGYPVTVAGIQSAYRNVEDFPACDLIIIDEAHRIPSDGEGMYRTFLEGMKKKNPNVRLIGFTATPYRMGTGPICSGENLLNKICFEVSVRELIAKGHLSHLVSRGPTEDHDFSGVHVQAGEFDQAEIEKIMSTEYAVMMAVCDIISLGVARKSILLFASGVRHGQLVASMVREQTGEEVGEVYGDTPPEERERLVRKFRGGELRWLVNVNVFTLGFDAPNVDCVGLLRATLSPGLYYQMVGRGFRVQEGKKNCLVLDFGGNIMRHGPVDTIDVGERSSGNSGEGPVKKCPGCYLYVPAGVLVCPDCGHQFPPREKEDNAPHGARASSSGILSGTPQEVEVQAVRYYPHTGQSGIPSMRVDYLVGFETSVSEFICVQHSGYAKQKAYDWWKRRTTMPMPETAAEASGVAERSGLLVPSHLIVDFSGKHPKITAYKFSKEAVPF